MKEWRKQKILDLYIHDYLMRKKMKITADILAQEAGVQVKSVALDEGFLEDFWSIFWDVHVSRRNKNPQEDQATTSEAASSDLSVTENTCIKSAISPAMKSPVMGSLLQNVVDRTLPEPTSDERWTEGHFRHL